MIHEHDLIQTYHRETSHTRGRITGRSLNREETPVPFKLYRGGETFHLSQDLALPDIPLDIAHNARPLSPNVDMPSVLAGICNLACGITQVRKQMDGSVFHFRSVASAGALYPAELYIALQNVTGLNDGLYHYCPLEHTLTRLRGGFVFGALRGTAPIIRFYLTSIFHRSSWKYGARAYRYCLLDTGHLVENLVLAARLYGLPATLDYDFNDRAATRFLCIDPDLEGCLAQVHSLGCKAGMEVDEAVQIVGEGLPAFSRSAPKAVSPEQLLAIHGKTSSFARCPVQSWAVADRESTPLPPPVIAGSASAAMVARRSRRNFVPRTTPTRDLVDIISMLCDRDGPVCSNAIEVGILASENSGLTAGHHRINRKDRSTTLLRPGNFMAAAARVCLDQSWLENCALHFVFTTDLEALSRHCGPRAYRYAHLEAGRLGQQIYLAATAKGLGACGIGAFFDNEVATLLALPRGQALIYLVGVGPVRK